MSSLAIKLTTLFPSQSISSVSLLSEEKSSRRLLLLHFLTEMKKLRPRDPDSKSTCERVFGFYSEKELVEKVTRLVEEEKETGGGGGGGEGEEIGSLLLKSDFSQKPELYEALVIDFSLLLLFEMHFPSFISSNLFYISRTLSLRPSLSILLWMEGEKKYAFLQEHKYALISPEKVYPEYNRRRMECIMYFYRKGELKCDQITALRASGWATVTELKWLVENIVEPNSYQFSRSVDENASFALYTFFSQRDVVDLEVLGYVLHFCPLIFPVPSFFLPPPPPPPSSPFSAKMSSVSHPSSHIIGTSWILAE